MKITLSLLILFMFASVLMFADVKNNFQQNRIQFSVQSCLYNNWGRNFDEDKAYDHTELSLYSSINYFVADKFSLGVFTGLSWTDYHSHSGSYTENFLDLTMGFNGEYYLIPLSNKKTRLIPSVGTTLALTFAPPQSEISYTNMGIFPYMKLSYFVNKRIAPYIKGGVNANFLLSKRGSSGNVEDFDFMDEITFSAGLFLGFSYYVPNKKLDKSDKIH